MSTYRSLYLYPFEHNNGFIDRTKEVYARQGFHIEPLKALFSSANLGKREKNTVVLNWYEDQPFRKGLKGLRRILFIFSFFISIMAMRLFSHRIIWLRHNFKPHNLARENLLFRVTVWLLNKVAHQTVTLEPVNAIFSQVVRHPLYQPDAALSTVIEQTRGRPRTIDYLYFGVIKPYKRLDKLLKSWPVSQSLTIMGKCSDEAHTRLLNEIISQRNLDVTWHNAFIEQDDLEKAVADARYVIIPHEDGAMISSGTFYMALSLGANVLCFDSEFGRAKAAEFSFVQVLDAAHLDTQLPALSYTSADIVIEQAIQKYGDREVQLSWRKVL